MGANDVSRLLKNSSAAYRTACRTHADVQLLGPIGPPPRTTSASINEDYCAVLATAERQRGSPCTSAAIPCGGHMCRAIERGRPISRQICSAASEPEQT